MFTAAEAEDEDSDIDTLMEHTNAEQRKELSVSDQEATASFAG